MSDDVAHALDEGIALYQAGDGFEAHEAWERIWRTATGDDERVLHALIKLAAAMVKVKQKNVVGVLSHARGALAHLEPVQQNALGVDVAHVREIARAVEANAHALVDGSAEARAVFGVIKRA